MTDWLSLAIGVFGVLLAIFIYIKSKREKSPLYSIYSQNIIREYISSIENLEIKYAGQKIKTLTISRVAFWNEGKEIINWNDNTESAPLSIRVKNGYTILGAEITKWNESTNMFSFVEVINKNALNIKFDYISKNNGFIALVYHTGKSDADIEISGKLKGVDKIERIDVDTLKAIIDFLYNIAWGIIFLAVAICFYFLIKTFYYLLSNLVYIPHLETTEFIFIDFAFLSTFFIAIKDSKLLEKLRLGLRKEIINDFSILPSELDGFILDSNIYVRLPMQPPKPSIFLDND